MKIKLIITGATGMVGEGVLFECLQREDVEQILSVSRRPCGIEHPKLREIVHKDFFDLTPIADQLKGYDGCLFCLGVSSIGMKEKEFYSFTYTLTMHMAEILANQNKDMVFCYISGAGTDSTEKGSRMWARVKGKTENDLMKLPFKRVYAFRPGLLKPTKGQKRILRSYKFLGWLYPIIKTLFPKAACSIKELGLAMINAVVKGYPKDKVEVTDIVALAKE